MKEWDYHPTAFRELERAITKYDDERSGLGGELLAGSKPCSSATRSTRCRARRNLGRTRHASKAPARAISVRSDRRRAPGDETRARGRSPPPSPRLLACARAEEIGERGTFELALASGHRGRRTRRAVGRPAMAARRRTPMLDGPANDLTDKADADEVGRGGGKRLSHPWAFRARFRRSAFGWKSQPAITRVREAVSEIKKVATRASRPPSRVSPPATGAAGHSSGAVGHLVSIGLPRRLRSRPQDRAITCIMHVSRRGHGERMENDASPFPAHRRRGRPPERRVSKVRKRY